MPLPDPDERSNDKRNLKIEFAVLLALLLVGLVAGIRTLWDQLTAWF